MVFFSACKCAMSVSVLAHVRGDVNDLFQFLAFYTYTFCDGQEFVFFC